MDSEYLYHYTSVEALGSILKNQSIRFNSLDKVDDLQEQETEDIKNIGQFYYISSWTEEGKESIRMWNMYAKEKGDNGHGVRIALRKNPFLIYENKPSDIEGIARGKIVVQSDVECIKSIIPFKEMLSEGFIVIQKPEDMLRRVEYTDDENKLYPKLLIKDNSGEGINYSNVGTYKNTYWKFQKELRYIFFAIPLSVNQNPGNATNDYIKIYFDMKLGKAHHPFEYYDLKIAEDAFKNMKITLSPYITTDMKLETERLIKEYNPSAIIEKSIL